MHGAMGQTHECSGATGVSFKGYDALCAGETLCVWTEAGSYTMAMAAPDSPYFVVESPGSGAAVVDYAAAVARLVDLPSEYVITTPAGELIEGWVLGW